MNQTKRILLLVENSRQFGRELARGIARYSAIHGPWTFYREELFYRTALNHQKSSAWFKKWKPDGIIARDFENTRRLKTLGVPLILVESVKDSAGRRPCVIADNFKIGRMAAEHLLGKGFTNFAYCGFNELLWSNQRGTSFGKLITDSGRPLHFYEYPQKTQLLPWEKESQNLIKWLRSLPRPVGILACNDDRGRDILEACKLANIKVPCDIAVMGVDNDDQICALTNPPLSSIALSTEQAGYGAASLLAELMAGKKVRNTVVTIEPTHIAARQSTDTLAIQDRQVAEVLQFVRQNIRRILQVSDVLNAMGYSRRSLEARFSNIMGNSLYREIKRLRIEKINLMLRETNYSISRIAKEFGYDMVNHFARYYKQETGLSPHAYRKRFIR